MKLPSDLHLGGMRVRCRPRRFRIQGPGREGQGLLVSERATSNLNSIQRLGAWLGARDVCVQNLRVDPGDYQESEA